MVRVLALAALGFALGVPGSLIPGVGSRIAHAGTCPPAVALTGDAEAVRAVRAQLDARGIADENPGCPVVRARIERRGALLVVGITPGASSGAPPGASPGAPIDAAPGPTIERAVGEPATAASVIESWARSDLAAPLLETRAVPVIDATPAAIAPAPPAQGIQLFFAEETSLASDHTVWEGMQLGACVMLGPICAAARVHGAKVIAKPDGWDRFVRKGAEAYVGIDIPVTVGRIRLTPGFAAGYGTMLTHHIGDLDAKSGIEISGPRAEAHLALAIPLTPHIAIDLATTAELTQATGMETHGSPVTGDPAILFPDEPRALLRFAIGVRYGAL